MAYRVSLTARAYRALERIQDPSYSNIKEAIRRLGDNPRPHGYKKLKGVEGYRIRVGDYRIIYAIFDKVLLVQVINLGHRRHIYN